MAVGVARTTKGGQYFFPLPAGKYSVEATRAGWLNARVPLKMREKGVGMLNVPMSEKLNRGQVNMDNVLKDWRGCQETGLAGRLGGALLVGVAAARGQSG